MRLPYIREVAFRGSGLIREVAFGGSGLIREVAFDGSGLIRRGLLNSRIPTETYIFPG